jgi:methylmalonyl-CoA mutase
MVKLFSQFPPVSKETWMNKVISDLKGADFNTKLVWKTREGFDLMPLYRQEDITDFKYIESFPGHFPFLRGNKCCHNRWRIRQNLDISDYKGANKKVIEILRTGVDSPGFYILDPETISKENLDDLLREINLEDLELNFLSDGNARELTNFFLSILDEKGYDPKKIRAVIEADPLGRLFLNGTLCIPVEKGFDYLADICRLVSNYPAIRTININASAYRNVGAGIVKELALGISMGLEYLSQLTDRGINIETAASRIRFSFATGSDYFPEIAKLRSARLLWSAVINGFKSADMDAARMEIHCTTGKWNKSIEDPFINMLRTQTEAMAAILGGTDSLTVEPYDNAFKQPDEFSERLARNQQLILREEAYFDKVADPSAGSWYIENLTNVIADKAWKLFLEIEETGGFLESLKKGFIHEKIKESVDRSKYDVSKPEMEVKNYSK